MKPSPILIVAVVMSSATLTLGTTSYDSIVLGDNPVSYWPMQETVGPTIHDIVSTNNGTMMVGTNPNGTGYSTTFVTNSGSAFDMGGPGALFGGALSDTAIYFTNANNGFISVPYSSQLNTASFTVEAWLYFPNWAAITPNPPTVDVSPLSMVWNGGTQAGWMIDIDDDEDGLTPGSISAWCAKSTFAGWNQTPYTTVSKSSQWCYTVVTYNGTTLTLYTNAAVCSTQTGAYGKMSGSSVAPLLMGAMFISGDSEVGRIFQGGISHVAYYGSALTVNQIANHYYYGTNTAISPSITTQPAAQTNYVGLTATFTAGAAGFPPLYFQWMAGATGSGVYTNLIAGGQFSVVTNTTLTISNLVLGNMGNYLVVVTNSHGSVTSSVAPLTVLNPAPASILTQPVSQTNYVGLMATFTVGATGFPPLYYQWMAGVTGSGVYTNLMAGGQFSAVTNATLTISNLVLGNTADYVVAVTNAYEVVTSSVATLTVQTNSAPTTYYATILADHPVSYWPMQETVAPIIHDIVGTNNGTMQRGSVQYNSEYYSAWTNDNGSSFGMGGPGILHNVPNDKAIYFTNLNATFISIPYSPSLNSSVFSVEAWLNIPNYPHNFSYLPASEAFALLDFLYNGDQPCLGWELNVENGEYQDVDAYQSGVIGAWQGQPGGADWNMITPTEQYTNQWVYTTLTYNGTNLDLYVDGISIVSATEGYGQPSGANVPALGLIMGAQMPKEPPIFLGDFYEGGMSHVAYYNYALSTSQITNHYYMGTKGAILPPPPTPIISVQQSNMNITLSWTNGFLQQASSVNGPWTDVLPTNQVSPYATLATNPSMFFRASNQP